MFTFQQFTIDDTHCAMKVGTDGVLLGAWADLGGARRVLDVGCGSGLVTLMAAQRAPGAEVTGVEIDPAAAGDALRNALASPFRSRVRIVCADVLHFVTGAGAFDHVVSNPPFFEEELLPPGASRAAARHTAGGGLTFAALLKAVAGVPGVSRFSLILPTAALPRFLPLAACHGFTPARRTDVVTRPGKAPKRTLLELRTQPAVLRCDTLTLAAPDGGRSEEYAALCRDFYLPRRA